MIVNQRCKMSCVKTRCNQSNQTLSAQWSRTWELELTPHPANVFASSSSFPLQWAMSIIQGFQYQRITCKLQEVCNFDCFSTSHLHLNIHLGSPSKMSKHQPYPATTILHPRQEREHEGSHCARIPQEGSWEAKQPHGKRAVISVEHWPPCPLPNRGTTHKVINTDHTRTAEHKKDGRKWCSALRCSTDPPHFRIRATYFFVTPNQT